MYKNRPTADDAHRLQRLYPFPSDVPDQHLPPVTKEHHTPEDAKAVQKKKPCTRYRKDRCTGRKEQKKRDRSPVIDRRGRGKGLRALLPPCQTDSRSNAKTREPRSIHVHVPACTQDYMYSTSNAHVDRNHCTHQQVMYRPSHVPEWHEDRTSTIDDGSRTCTRHVPKRSVLQLALCLPCRSPFVSFPRAAEKESAAALLQVRSAQQQERSRMSPTIDGARLTIGRHAVPIRIRSVTDTAVRVDRSTLPPRPTARHAAASPHTYYLYKDWNRKTDQLAGDPGAKDLSTIQPDVPTCRHVPKSH